MKPSSDFDREVVIGGMVRADEQPKAETPVPEIYLRAVAKAVKYLSLHSTGAPDLATMDIEDRQRYVLGYAVPFLRASVPADVLWRLGEGDRGGGPGEACVRWTERPARFFPRNPGELLEICLTVMRERAPGWKPQLALDAPPPSREERNRQRVRLGLKPLLDLEEEGASDA